ncbi:DNA-binding protein [Jiangella ureilytica]|uniref:DNA-binding protein n=1 Tax=Jiangella ureilytica TaxID=2530374 RepID=A0A4R4RFB1_9ACTN|nr:helix-turn-helix domain-containing protein [Jiangella ureilytica]TDC47093.1 DNA-binding protein [Jiangella ureilytica]
MTAPGPDRRPAASELPLYTAEEAATLLRCKASWLKEQARLRRIPFTMVAGAYRFTRAHLIQIVESNEHRIAGSESELALPPERVITKSQDAIAPLTAHPPRRPRRPT